MAIRSTVWRWNDMRDQRRNRKAPLEQFMEGWLLWGNFQPKTRSWYRDVFLRFVDWMRDQGAEGVLGELDPLLVRKWQYGLETKGRSANTVRGYLAALKSFSRYLAEERIVLGKDQQPVNLLSEVKVPRIPRSRPQVYKDDELEQILAGINRHHQYGARNLAVIRVMLDGGLRLREACGMLLDDIDWETGRLRVRWQVAKRQKERDAYVGRRTLLELRRYVEDYRPHGLGLDLLFIDQDGGPLTPHAVQSVFLRLKRKLGLKKLSAHQFRRTWATNYRKHGVGDLYDLQLEGGWEDLEVPQRFYVDVERPRAERASVMDRWETEQRKRERGERAPQPRQSERKSSSQVRGPVQGSQVRELRSGRPGTGLKRS